MSISLRVARTPKEKDDALWVRHEVFVVEDGKFGGQPLSDARMVDRYDVVPDVEHLIAYEGPEPVATLRLNRDRGLGLPAEHYFDFSPWRRMFEQELAEEGGGSPVVVSGGMLAVRKNWRSRRDVIRALYKIASTVLLGWGCTHVIAAVNYETASIYRRASFQSIAEKFWVDEVGNYIIPLIAYAPEIYKWAFGEISDGSMEIFKDTYKRTLLRPGEMLFHQGDQGNCAYIVDAGNIRVSRVRSDGSSFVLAVLGKGEMVGELALVDDQPRSATAEALGDVELIDLERQTFGGDSPSGTHQFPPMLKLFASRLRRTDELAMVLASESVERKLEFAMQCLRDAARPDLKRDGALVARVGVDELARTAVVERARAQAYLSALEQRGDIEVRDRKLIFLR